MQPADIAVIKQIIILTLLGLTGFAAGRTKYLPDNSGVILSRVVIKLTAPLLIITKMSEYSFGSDTLKNGFWILASGVFFILIAGLLGWGASHVLNLQSTSSNVYKMLSMFGNVIFMAYPLLSAIYPEKGIVYAIFFNIANDLVLWTLGIFLVNRHVAKSWKDNIKHLINGNTIAFGIGVLFIVINLQDLIQKHSMAKRVYSILFDTFSPLGHTTIYLSMLFIGLILSEIKIGNISDIVKRYPLFVLAALKLLVVPFIAMAVLYAAGDILSPMVKSIIVLQLAMPCGTIVSALASQYNSDYRFATEGVFVTTILSIVTLPLVAHLTQIFG
ncbi:MAG: AEC family transporter [Clostridia bacterium]|nr:AEC family transporter [Clostridia bacterium]